MNKVDWMSMGDTPSSGRRPIFMIDTAGKSAEELAHEAWEAIQGYWRATGQIEPDQNPEPEPE
jgi:hypothetical protein